MLFTNSCTTTKRKGEVSKVGKVYHNTTAQYNGYFNANELYIKSIMSLNEVQQDNYNQLLPLYTYRDIADASSVEPDLNIAIEKVSRVINLHRVSSWTDDCYLLLGKSQYLKQDFETAEKTFEYFVDEMNPAKLKVLKKKPATKSSKKKSSSRKKSKKSSKKKSKSKADKTDKAKAEKVDDGGLFSKEPAYNEGLVWMGKTYVERDRYPSAAYIISKLESSPLSENVAKEVPVLKAYFFIQQKKYAEAIAPLKKAVQLSKKQDKSRYAYILAQIYEILENEKDAYNMYEVVLDNTSNYEMEFNAQLNLFKNAPGGDRSETAILKELDKLLKEDKYAEYRDQIYFTKAEIKFKNGDFTEAYKFYQLSLKNNLSNDALKAEVYYKLANRYFEDELYLEAKNNFDSTKMFMPQTDDRYSQVDKFGQNLNQIANNIGLIQLQDSLIKVSKMSREEQEAVALGIKQERDRIRKLQETGGSGKGKDLAGNIDRTTSGMDLSKVSSFFAYNPNSIRIGRLDFDRRWGDRDLEDDWRRSNKQGGFGSDDEEEENDQNLEELSDAEFKTLLKDVPFNAEELEASHKMISTAMLDLGVLYREKLDNYQLSAETLQQLIDQYPGFDEECRALYYLHLSSKNIKDETAAIRARNLMVSNHPDCSFTLALTDPEYLDKQMALLNKKESYFQDIFLSYEESNYVNAMEMINMAPDDLRGDESYAPKLDFLEAMCIGNLEGQEAYVNKLENLVKLYPNSPEEIKAKEILRFIKGDKQVFESLIYNEGLENFVMEEDKLHYIFVVFFGIDQEQLKEAKRNISKYNGKFHKLERLRISNIYLDTSDDIQIILIRKFDKKDDAMDYYYKVDTRQNDFLPGSMNYEIYAISQKNYREVIKQRTVNNYRDFFSDKYLEQDK